MELQRARTWTRKFSLLMCVAGRGESHSDYSVSLQIKAGTAPKKSKLKTSQAFGSQARFPVHLVQLRFDIIQITHTRVKDVAPSPFFSCRLSPRPDIFLAAVETLTHKSHLSNDTAKRASKCQHTARSSGDSENRPRDTSVALWPVPSASSHLQVI